MAGNLSGTVGDVLQTVGEQGTPGIPRGGGVVRCLVQNLELGLQSFKIEKEKRSTYGGCQGEEILFKETLPATLASASVSIARAVEVSPSAADNTTWVASRHNSRRLTSRVALE
jgi:hypothetical protein